MFSFLDMLGNYESRRVARDALTNGATVSTAYTSDEGYETAVIDATGKVFPVQRYGSDVEAAKVGHAEWVRKAAEFKNGEKVLMLGGFHGFVDDEEATLELA